MSYQIYSDEVLHSYCPACGAVNEGRPTLKALRTIGFTCGKCEAHYTVGLRKLRKGSLNAKN